MTINPVTNTLQPVLRCPVVQPFIVSLRKSHGVHVWISSDSPDEIEFLKFLKSIFYLHHGFRVSMNIAPGFELLRAIPPLRLGVQLRFSPSPSTPPGTTRDGAFGALIATPDSPPTAQGHVRSGDLRVFSAGQTA